ncbi:hypothetical protein MJL81_28960, partial [Salmonella enterica subsp. enterica serovar Anatum]|nr:hypothetical protein [Salmonella enterica subsp. enterica serovar Anatum]
MGFQRLKNSSSIASTVVFPDTGDERASIQRACEAGVEKIIVPATEAAHFPRVLALAARFPSL